MIAVGTLIERASALLIDNLPSAAGAAQDVAEQCRVSVPYVNIARFKCAAENANFRVFV
jgi:hypothetical protein